MASAPTSPDSPTIPLPLTPLTNSSTPPTESPPSPSDASPPLPSTIPPPPPIELAPPPSDPPPPPLIASPPPESSPPPPPPSPEVFLPPPPSPPAVVPTPAVVNMSPPLANSPPTPPPPESVKSPPPPPFSATNFSPPPLNSSSPLAPPPSVKSHKHSGSTPTTSKPSISNTNGDDTVLQNSSNDNDQAVKTGIAIGVVLAFVIICFSLVVICVRRRRKRHDRYNSVYMLPSQFASPQDSGSSFMKPMPSVGSVGGSGGGSEFMNLSPDSGILGNSKTWFSYEELNAATSGFASQNILGAGGFGCVYKGFLQDGRVVAVKKLKDNSGQGDREFKAEVETISRVHHRHLVSLVGYCVTDYQRLLVYEFLPNNTLHYHLHATSKPVMEWSLRVKAACGSARGLAYLHEDCHPKIIHRDIKSANILLDQNFEAKVADFGLAKLAQELDLNTHISTRVMGTFGYMAPEYASSGKLTEKSDVFSFGVVLLELITGRKPVDETRPLGEESLVEWARPLMSEALDSQNFDQLADRRLQGNYDRGEMFRMVEAAAACVRHSSSKRPKMSQVVRALDTISELSDISNGIKPGQSGIFDSREQSAQIRMFQRMAFGSQDFSSEYGNSQSSWASGAGRRSGLM